MCRPSCEVPRKKLSIGVEPLVGPVETRFVVLPTRSYTSLVVSVSALTSDSFVSNTARDPSLEAS